jgi:hypothetical protein
MITRLGSALIFALLATALVGTVDGEAQTFARKDFSQLVGEAEQIFVGPVTAAVSRRLPDGLIVTDVTFSPVRGLKGAVGPSVVLEVVGGTVNGLTLKLEGVPSFEVGRHYVVFSKENRSSVFPVVGGDQGLFTVETDAAGRAGVVLDASRRPVTGALVGRSATGRAAAGLPMTLDVFLAEIQARVGP